MFRRQLCIIKICMLSLGVVFVSGCNKKEEKSTEESAEKKAEEDKKSGKQTNEKTNEKVKGKSSQEKTKLTKESLEKLMETEVDGFQKQPGDQITKVMGIPMASTYFKGTEGNKNDMTAFVQLRIHGCGHCPELSASTFEGEKALFEKMMLSKAHKENPHAVFEIKDDTIAGKKVVTIYRLSFVVSEDGRSRSSMHGFSVYHHNGENMLHVNVSARGFKGFKSAKDLDELKSLFTREEMKAAATEFVKAFAPKLF